MNLRHWHYFLRVAEAGSLSRVTELTGIAQPALSRQIQSLEAELGTTLLVRTSRGVSLTPAGEVFRERAAAILGEIAALPEEVRASADEPSGLLSVGLPISMSAMVAAPLVAELKRRYPTLRLHVLEGTSLQIRDAVAGRRCEIGILALPQAEPSLAVQPLLREPLVLFGPPGSGLSKDRPLTIDELAALPLILTSRPNSLRVTVEHAIEGAGHQPNVVMEVEAASIAEFVARGVGYSTNPACIVATRAFGEGLTWAPIEGLSVTWALCRLKGQRLSVGAGKAVQIIAELIQERVGAGIWQAEVIGNSLAEAMDGRLP